MLLRTLAELLRLRLMRSSLGSAAFVNPPARANRTKMSVRLTTPTRRPEMRAPGSAEAEILGPVGMMKGVFGDASATAVPEESPGTDDATGGPLGAEMEEE